MAKILKFWHQWSWMFHIAAWAVAATIYVVRYEFATADNSRDIAALQDNYRLENLKTRMAVQENQMSDIRESLNDIRVVQGKIFDRIDKLADRGHQ